MEEVLELFRKILRDQNISFSEENINHHFVINSANENIFLPIDNLMRNPEHGIGILFENLGNIDINGNLFTNDGILQSQTIFKNKGIVSINNNIIFGNYIFDGNSEVRIINSEIKGNIVFKNVKRISVNNKSIEAN